jgi:hypothetical protein
LSGGIMPSCLRAGRLLGKHRRRRTGQNIGVPGERFVLAGEIELGASQWQRKKCNTN